MSTEVTPRRPIEVLRDRNFGPFFTGKVMSSCGIWIQNVAAAVLMYDLTGSAFMVGLVSAVQFSGPLVLALWAGALTDRVDRRKLLMTGRVIAGSAVGTLGILVAVLGRDGFGGAPVLLAGVLGMGLGLALSSPAMHALVPALVPDEDLEQALALNSAAPSIARTIGPAIGAGLLLLQGPALAFAVAALGHWSFVAALTMIRARPRQQPRSRPRALGGLGYLMRDRKAAVLLVAVAATAFGADPIITLTPSLADQLGGRSGLVGALATSFGVGSVAATMAVRSLRQRFNLRVLGMVAFWILAAGLALAAAAPLIPTAVAGFALAGAGFLLANVALTTRIQRRIPDELRGRVMALWGVAFLGSRPLAALANGSIAELASVRAALLASAAVALGSSLLARVSYSGSSTQGEHAEEGPRPEGQAQAHPSAG